MSRLTRCIFGGLFYFGLASAVARAAEPAPSTADLDFFEKKIRPVLAERCYKCHSGSGEKIKGNLRLDSAEFWLKGGDSGAAVVTGNPDASLLIEAIRYKNPDLEMPPKGKLSDAEIELLVQWVKQGAPAPRGEAIATTAAKKGIDLEAGRKFWAYQPVRKVGAPEVKDAAWPKTNIDRFVLAKLESQGLHPVADADPASLVRRVYFDLIGLPPTPDQIDAYLADTSTSRYEQLVNRLLASPQFGERWGRHWLDVARFGESLTLRGFVIKDAWRYRDYVIESFNHDRPFDQFMAEQVAGDLMPAASLKEKRRQLVGTAFLAIGNTNLEEQDKKQLEMDVVDEQIDTIGRAFLAQTIGCARCHDHKFDPIPTKDYYGLAGILHSTRSLDHSNVSKWLDVPLPVDGEHEAILAKHESAIATLQDRIKKLKSTVAKAKRTGKPSTVVAATTVADLPGIVVDDLQANRVGTWKESVSVRPFIGTGYLTDNGDRSESKTLTFLLEGAEPGKYEVRFAYTASENRANNVSITIFSADGEKSLTVDEREVPPIGDHFVSLGQFNFEKNGQSFVIVSNQDANGHVIADAVQFLPADAVATAATPVGAGTSVPDKEVVADAKTPATTAELKHLEAELKKLTDGPTTRETVPSVREAKEMGDSRVNIRGSVHTLGDNAPRGFLHVVSLAQPAIPQDQSGRLQLGQWLADPKNPLPSRVVANRVWHWLMGTGIVRTTDNFGTTGELPSNVQLLDYLAARLVEERWSMKSMIREVMLSHAYQLSTAGDAKALSVDPENRLQWRMNHRRLDAECIRDTVLSVSGQLGSEGGGRSFKAELKSDFGFVQSDLTHRSVYLPVFRNALPEIFEVFDFADPSVSNGRRNVSTVAPQALFLMNSLFVTDQAKRAAGRLLADAKLADDDARLVWAYRVTLGRGPTAGERTLATRFLQEGATGGTATNEAWAQVFHALFASLDFRYVN